MEQKLIEHWFPIKSVGIEGQKEKQVGVGRISSIHQYHARRPTCAARAIILSTLLNRPSDKETLKALFNLVSTYGLRNIPEKIQYKNKIMPLIDVIQSVFSEQGLDPSNLNAFDPFAGGGTFPLEMSALGINTYASDLNPIAILIEKATCEYPQKFGLELIKKLEKYFTKVQGILEKEIGQIYRNEIHPENEINFFVWARQIPCTECGLWIPIIKNFNLSKKYHWALIPKVPNDEEGNEIDFVIGWPSTTNGYFKRGKVQCPRCSRTIPHEIVMKQVSENKKDRLIAIYENRPDQNSTAHGSFRIASQLEIKNANIIRHEIIKELVEEYPLIDIKFQEKVSAWGVQNYGITSVLKCFNSRQLLLLKRLLDIIKHLKPEIERSSPNLEFSKAIILYLTFGLTKIADNNSTLTELNSSKSPIIRNTWTRPGLFMKGMPYLEVNPLKRDTTGGWLLYFNHSLKRVLNNLISKQRVNNNVISIKQMDAMDLEYPDLSMDFCFTDPPYYDNVPYAAATDFFYAWLKAVLISVFPELFLTPSTPKDVELVQDSFRHGGFDKAKIFYEKGMVKAFTEIHRILKENGIVVIIFAHRDANAWETLLQAIIDSELIITNTWPLLMETSHGIRGKDVVTLDSVILLVCRKLSRNEKIYFDEKFRRILEKKIRVKLEHQWQLGFRGADFFLSAIGPSIEAFSRFKAVLDVKNDEPIKLREYLYFVDRILVKFSLGKVLEKEETSTDGQTQLYLVWRSAYKLASLPYDEVWKFTNALGLDEKKLEGNFIKKVRVKSKIVYQCLDAVSKTEMFQKKKFIPSCLIEELQYAGFLWGENDSSLDDVITQSKRKYGSEFWYVAQALCNLTPDAPEVRLFSGLLRKYGIKQKKKPEKKSPDLQSYFNNTGKRSKEEK